MNKYLGKFFLTRKIYFDASGKIHSLYNEMILNPPKGYTFIKDAYKSDILLKRFINNSLIYNFQEEYLNNLFPVNLYKAYLEKTKKIPKDIELSFSPGHLIFRNEPWVVDLEYVTQLSGYNIHFFKKYQDIIVGKLASYNCRKIICYTESSKKTIMNTLNRNNIIEKIEVIYLAVTKKNFIKKQYLDDKIKILFVGSINIPGEFEYKGGKEVILAFKKLNKIYPDIELVIRSDLSKEYKSECKKIGNITVYDKIISGEKLDEEFRSSNIFWFPGYATPGMVFLEAMSYELPIITTDVWANPEIVIDGENGFLIEKSKKIKHYDENYIPLWNYQINSKFMKSIRFPDIDIIDNLVYKTAILINDEKLRKSMGLNGREEVENGKFSLEKRNKKLTRVFDESIY
jgi:glycosyltransferase involved in cell wall biosynthesis